MIQIPASIPWQAGSAGSAAGQALARQALGDMAGCDSPAEAYDKGMSYAQRMAGNSQAEGVDSTEFMLSKAAVDASKQVSTPVAGLALMEGLMLNLAAGPADNIGVAMARVGYLAMTPAGLPLSPQDAAVMGLAFTHNIADCASYDDRAQAESVIDQCTGLQNYPGGSDQAAGILAKYLYQEAAG